MKILIVFYFIFMSNVYCIENDTTNIEKIKVRVGHIGAINAMPKAESILEICRKELWKEGILNEDFDVEILSEMGCGQSFEGVAVAADMYHQQNVKVFIGPYCNAELDAVGKMAAYWNLPIIGYMASNNVFADKSIYKTLARVSLRTTNSLAIAVSSLVNHYSWTRVAIVTNTGSLAYERTVAFEEVFHENRITVLKKIIFDENADTQHMISSGYLDELKDSARIVICIFSTTRDTAREFMQAIAKVNMNSDDFVYIFPWLQAEAKETLPWIGADGQLLQNIKELFTNTFIVDDTNGFDNTLVTPFKERLESNGISIDQLNMQNIYGYIHLYDALKLYALASRTALNETNNRDIITDGRYLWNKMRRMSFPGLISRDDVTSSLVMMDDLAERAGIYGGFYVSLKHDDVLKVIELTPIPIKNCDGIKNKSNCFELKIRDIHTNFWTTIDGITPVEEPVCGFRNENCHYTLIIIIVSIIIALLLLSCISYIIYHVMETKTLEKTAWRIFRDDMRIINNEEMKSMLSIGSTTTKLSNMMKFSKHHAIVGTNTHASLHLYPQKRPIKFNRDDLQTLTMMKQVVHDNLNPFLGMAFNENEEMLLLWKFCSRGTVQDIIYNEELTIDNKFHAAFIRDITLGLEYLHLSPIGYHGSLTPWACLIDRNWMVKLTDYGIANPLEKWQKKGIIGVESVKDDDDKTAATQYTGPLYQPPEVLKIKDQNKRRNLDQSWIKQTQNRRQFGDIYSFGIVMYEILFKSLPFPEDMEVDEYIQNGKRAVKPSIQKRNDMHPDIISLLQDCWSENPEIRPSIRRVRLNTESYLKVKGSLVDQMMRMMEEYANNLEKVVKERTGLLEEANKKADKLLSQLLPAYVANELKMGNAVPPKTFKQASVMFSDIVGFTKICSSSTPLEVVTMLNCVYTGFDNVINKHEAYKVETIGDAYMVVSGIPQLNGFRHLMHLSDVALEMMQFLNEFQIPHQKTEKIKIRLGLHTGAVAAGVIGLTAPRYCLFGDTVNMAARMESTGVPEMIQISEDFKLNLNEHYPHLFKTELRGTVEVKGKGAVTTYFLERNNVPDILVS